MLEVLSMPSCFVTEVTCLLFMRFVQYILFTIYTNSNANIADIFIRQSIQSHAWLKSTGNNHSPIFISERDLPG